MNRFCLVLGLWLLAWTARAGDKSPPTTQDLWREVQQHPQPDTGRVRRLNYLADAKRRELAITQLDSLGREALQLARRLNDAHGQAYALYNLAMSGYTPTGTVTSKQQNQAWLRQALPLARHSGDQPLLSRILLQMSFYEKPGLPYLRRALALTLATRQPALLADYYYWRSNYYLTVVGNYYLSLQSQFEELRVARQAHLAEQEAAALLNIGRRYKYLGDYDQAQIYFRRTVGRASALADTWRGAYWKSSALYHSGDCYRFSGRYAQAAEAYAQAVRTSNNIFATLTAKSGLADTYERQGSPQALPYARQVLLETRRPLLAEQRLYAQLLVSTTLGHYFLRNRLADSAVYYGRKALALTRYITLKEPVRDALQLLAQAYAQRRQYAQAYSYQNRYLGLKDTLNNAQVSSQVTAARFAHDLARQKSQIALLTKSEQLQAEAARRQRLLLGATLTVLALIGGLLFVLARSFRLQQRANELLQRQKAELQTQRDQTAQALTNLKATQQQLIQAEKMASLGELTAGIAHEIQNPLNFVTNFADLSAELVQELREAPANGAAEEALETELWDSLTQNLHKITQHGHRAAGIVRGMLEHSRQSPGERQWTALNELCDEYLRLAYHGLRARHKEFAATLTTDFDPNLGLVEVQPQDLGRVLLNLLTNAFYAVRQRQSRESNGYQPEVIIRTRLEGNWVKICVHDNGVGIPEAVAAKIFQPFFTTKPPGEGTGLGLSLSYDIVIKGHGGTLTIDSREGEFTEVIVGLPVFADNNLEA